MKPQVVAVGIDSLNIGFSVARWLVGEDAFKILEDGKQAAGGKLFGGKGVTVKWADREFVILPKGSLGYEYLLHNNDIRLSIARKCQGGRVFPEVFVQMNSAYLWGKGYESAYHALIKWIGEWAVIVGEKINRVDLCADLAVSLPVLDVKKELVTRARKKVDFTRIEHYTSGRRDTGYRIGSGDLLARIYDKAYEIRGSEKHWFADIWERGGWDGKTGITRVEFQSRRQYLNEFSVNDYADMAQRLPDMWRVMTSEWLVLKTPNLHDSNHRRWQVSELWENVQQAGTSFGQCLGVQRWKQHQVKVDPLKAQIKGLIASWLAIETNIRGEYHALDRIKTETNAYLNSEDLRNKALERRGKYCSL